MTEQPKTPTAEKPDSPVSRVFAPVSQGGGPAAPSEMTGPGATDVCGPCPAGRETSWGDGGPVC